MAAPEALEAAESVPHAPGLQLERDQDTPLLWASFATVAVKVFVWPGWSVADAGVTVTDVAAWGVLEGGGAPAGVGENALEGTEAQPPARKAANRQSTATALGARATARTPRREFKVQVLRFFP
jgi:hypothetical protein